jgi:hypothetical protein
MALSRSQQDDRSASIQAIACAVVAASDEPFTVTCYKAAEVAPLALDHRCCPGSLRSRLQLYVSEIGGNADVIFFEKM